MTDAVSSASCALDRRERIVQLSMVLQREGWRVRLGKGFLWDTLSVMGVAKDHRPLVAHIAHRYAGPDTADVRSMQHGIVIVRYGDTLPPLPHREPTHMDYVNLYDDAAEAELPGLRQASVAMAHACRAIEAAIL